MAAPLSGGLLALCFPDWNLTGLIWVWMLPLLPAIWRGQKKRYGFGIAYLAGLTFWLINLKWLWTVSGIAAVALGSFLALYIGIWGAIAVSVGNPWRKHKKHPPEQSLQGSAIQQAIDKKLNKQTKNHWLGDTFAQSASSLKFAFITAAAWVGLEWLRGWLFTGFGWNGLGVTFHDTPVLAQAADLIGVTGLAFTPVFLSAVIIQTGRRLFTEAQTGKFRPRLDFAVAALLLATQFCYGVWRLRDVQGWDTQRVRILLVQENIPQTIKWDPASGAGIIQGYADSTIEAVNNLESEAEKAIKEHPETPYEFKTPDLIVWPESAMPDPLLFADNLDGYLIYGGVRSMLNEEVRPLGNFTLIAGMNEVEADYDPTTQRAFPIKGGKSYNSIATVSGRGQLEQSIQTYRKHHLVIFGEYIPFVNDLPWLKKLFEFSSGESFGGNFQSGESTEPLTVSVGESKVQLIPSVCFEDTVGRLTRKFIRPSTPQLIVNVTNDGWFKESEAAAQHWANAKFRAIELRRPMVRCANTGISGIITITGSVLDAKNNQQPRKRQVIEDANGNHFTRSTLYGHAYAPNHGPLTLYAVAGDWFAALMLGLVALFAVKNSLN
jgi:apolipoprotein N-acyltransferase